MSNDVEEIMDGKIGNLPQNMLPKRHKYNRVRYVAGLILLGYREGEIVRATVKKFPCARGWVIRKDIQKIRERWYAEGGAHLGKLRQDTMGQAIDMVYKAREDYLEKRNATSHDQWRRSTEFLARLLGIDRGVPQVTVTNQNIVQLTQNDVTPDGQPLEIEWASDDQKRPPGLNRMESMEFTLDD